MRTPDPHPDATDLAILTMLAHGSTYMQAAKALFIGHSTIKARISILRVQEGAKTTTHLVAMYLRDGKIEPPPRLAFTVLVP